MALPIRLTPANQAWAPAWFLPVRPAFLFLGGSHGSTTISWVYCATIWMHYFSFLQFIHSTYTFHHCIWALSSTPIHKVTSPILMGCDLCFEYFLVSQRPRKYKCYWELKRMNDQWLMTQTKSKYKKNTKRYMKTKHQKKQRKTEMLKSKLLICKMFNK